MTIQSQNAVLTDWLYDVQPIREISDQNRYNELGQNALFGSAFILGMPILGAPLNQPYQAFKAMDTKNGISFMDSWRNLSSQAKANKAALKGDNIWQSYQNRRTYNRIVNFGKELPTYDPNMDMSTLKGNKLLKYQNSVTKSGYYGDAKYLIEETKQMLENAKRNGTTIPKEQLKAQLSTIKEAMRAGDAKVNAAMRSGILKPTSLYGKAKHFAKLKTGGYKINEALLKTTRGASALKGAAKCVKGAGWMAAIEGLLEIPDIIGAYKIDKAEKAAGRKSNRGNKQLAKSTVKVGASVGGYILGAALTGAVVGTSAGPIGTFVGFLGGLIGGYIASKVAGKAMDAALDEEDSLDKSEVELYAEEQNKQAAQQAEYDANMASLSNDAQYEVLAAAVEKGIDNGDAPEDVLAAYEYLVANRESRILDSLANIANMDYAA